MNYLSKMKRQQAKRRLTHQKGFSMIEVVLASAVLSTVVLGGVTLQSAVMQTTRRNNDRAFATEKVVQMFEEMRAYTEANQEAQDFKLTNFSDGANYSTVLTTDVAAASADSTLSQNRQVGGTWKYVRQVQVDPVPNDNFAKHVKVSIWYGDKNGEPKGKALASLSGILKTNIPTTPPSQVFDYYTIAISNAPGWWSESYDFRPAYESVTTDLEYRNPGLKFRKHYVTNLGYGRDPFYLPHTNTQAHADAQDLPWAYYYPGKVKAENSGNQTKEGYVFSDMKSRLRGDSDTTQFHAWEKTQGILKYRPTSFADQFNNVMRFPELRAMERRVFDYAHSIPESATKNNSELQKLKDSLLQPTLASFLEDMNSNPSKYRHALITNIHAEQTPLPPLRNFSDPARLPLDEHVSPPANTNDLSLPANQYKYMRAVSHPEQLHYQNNDVLKWRVYAFDMNPLGRNGLDKNPMTGSDYTTDEIANRNVDVMTLFLPTDGRGRHPRDNGLQGYLDNPDFDPGAGHLTGFSFEKIIGSKNRKYEKIGQTAPANHRFNKVTNFDIWRTDLSAGSAHNAKVKYVGPLDAAVGSGNEIVIDAQNALSILGITLPIGAALNGPQSDEYRDLVNMRLIIDAGIPSASATNGSVEGIDNILRVKEVIPNSPGNGKVTLRFYPGQSLTKAHTAGAIVTVHKDYETSLNPTVHGQTRKGVLIKLFDTATRHEIASACSNTGNGYRCQGNEDKTGLPTDRRLFGLEYIPAPVSKNKTDNDLSDDFYNDLANTETNRNAMYENPQKNENDSKLENRAKNTARWVVSLDTSSTTDWDDELLTLETRLGDETHLEDGLNGDGDEYQPDDPATTAVNENDTLLRRNIYNVSRTYIYRGNYYPNHSEAGDAIPAIEQFEFLGDPRYMPYADLKKEHAYNPNFFLTSGNKSKFGSGGNQWGGYDGFDRQTGKYSGLDDIDADLPRLFSLYTNGLMKSNSIYNSIAGYTHYIYSIGGEFGNRGNHNYRYKLNPHPWFKGSEVPTGKVTNQENKSNSVAEQGTNANSRIITASYGAGSANNRWFARQHLGELFPDELFQFWKENGNLPNSAYADTHKLGLSDSGNRLTDANLPASVNGANTEFYRATYPESPMDLRRRERICHEGAISDFYNGSRDPANDIDDTMIHSTSGGKGRLTGGLSEAGRYLTEAFNLSLPESVDSNRSFCLSQDNGGCTSPHGANSSQFNKNERRAVRNTTKYLNVTGPDKGQTTGDASDHNAFYRFHQGNNSTPSKNVSSGIIKITREEVNGYVTGRPEMVGYAVINGLEQALDFGPQSLARLAVAATLQASLEGGDRSVPGAQAGRIVPLPRVEITQPRTASVETGNAINVEFDASWKRWDDKAYTPSYPSDWRDSTPLKFHAMYSSDNGKSWTYISDGVGNGQVPDSKYGYYNNLFPLDSSEPTLALPSEKVQKSFTWDTSTLSAGNYILRLEAYRDGRENGYGYHEVFLTLKK